MRFPIPVRGLEQYRVELITNPWNGTKSMQVNGQPVNPGPEKGLFLLQRPDGSTAAVRISPGPLLDPVPRVTIDGQPYELAPPLQWYEWIIVGFPVVLMVIGGGIGGALAGVSVVLNASLMRSKLPAPLKYVAGIAVTVIAFFILAVAAYKILGKPMPWVRTASLAPNAGFEDDGAPTQTPKDWKTWGGTMGGNADADFVEAGGHSGGYCLTQAKKSYYEVYTFQLHPNLANGDYRLSAWVKSSGGQQECALEAKEYGGPNLRAPVPAGGWSRISIDHIPVTNRYCTIGFYSRSNGGHTASIDDVEFVKNLP